MSKLDAFSSVPETPLNVDAEPVKNRAGKAMDLAAKIMRLASGEVPTVEGMQRARALARHLARSASLLEEEIGKTLAGIPESKTGIPHFPSVPPDNDQGVLREEEE